MGMTMAELTEAIRQHIDMEMDPEVACGMAEHALGFFGFYFLVFSIKIFSN